MKEVKRKNSQYRKARKISEEGLRPVLEEFENQGVERKTFQLWGVVCEKGSEERSCELAGPALDLITQWRRPDGEALWTLKCVQVAGGPSFPNINIYLSGSF